jgi:hypothetical protein
LLNVIFEAKQNNYNNQILRSNNKIKTTWEILNVEQDERLYKNDNIHIKEINMDGDSTHNPQIIFGVCSAYFLSVAETILTEYGGPFP